MNGRLQHHHLFSTRHTYMYFMLLSTCQFILAILVKHTGAFPMRVRQHDTIDFCHGQLNQLLSLNLCVFSGGMLSIFHISGDGLETWSLCEDALFIPAALKRLFSLFFFLIRWHLYQNRQHAMNYFEKPAFL